MIEKNIAHPFQGAFTKGKKGTDHIFIANTLIDQAKHLGHPLYAAFIDLQKANDSVCRPLLFRKMVIAGLGPKFCSLIENMYQNTSSCIKLANVLGTPFPSEVGLRQGDPLSPLLFNLFVEDLIFAFTAKCSPPTLHDLASRMISVIFLHWKRASIECTLEYCSVNRLKVNIQKSSFMVFNDSSGAHLDMVVRQQVLKYDPQSC